MRISGGGAGAYLRGGLLDRAHQGAARARARGDGYAGLEKAAPFDAILIAAAARRVPEALLRQLSPGSRMILPLHTPNGGAQRLVLIERSGRGFIESELDAVRFVPLEVGKA